MRFSQVGLAMWVGIWLCALPFRLRWYRLPALLARLTPAAGKRGQGRPQDLAHNVHVVVWVCQLRLFRLSLFPRACLRQSLALYYALSRLGYPVIVYFGVRKAADVFQGHSWVTIQGTPVAESTPVEVFRIMYAYPPISSGSVHRETGRVRES